MIKYCLLTLNLHHQQPGFQCLGMAPVVDGPGGFLPDTPYNLRQNGQFEPVPLLTGITRNGGAMFASVCKLRSFLLHVEPKLRKPIGIRNIIWRPPYNYLATAT